MTLVILAYLRELDPTTVCLSCGIGHLPCWLWHRCRTRRVQSYSSGGANVHPRLVHPNQHPHLTGAELLQVYRPLGMFFAGLFSSSKLPLRVWVSERSPNKWFLRRTWVQTASRSIQPFFPGLTIVTGWQTTLLYL